eukprot:15337010-Ditylum_brightwellii.AAC.1
MNDDDHLYPKENTVMPKIHKGVEPFDQGCLEHLEENILQIKGIIRLNILGHALDSLFRQIDEQHRQ